MTEQQRPQRLVWEVHQAVQELWSMQQRASNNNTPHFFRNHCHCVQHLHRCLLNAEDSIVTPQQDHDDSSNGDLVLAGHTGTSSVLYQGLVNDLKQILFQVSLPDVNENNSWKDEVSTLLIGMFETVARLLSHFCVNNDLHVSREDCHVLLRRLLFMPYHFFAPLLPLVNFALSTASTTPTSQPLLGDESFSPLSAGEHVWLLYRLVSVSLQTMGEQNFQWELPPLPIVQSLAPGTCEDHPVAILSPPTMSGTNDCEQWRVLTSLLLGQLSIQFESSSAVINDLRTWLVTQLQELAGQYPELPLSSYESQFTVLDQGLLPMLHQFAQASVDFALDALDRTQNVMSNTTSLDISSFSAMALPGCVNQVMLATTTVQAVSACGLWGSADNPAQILYRQLWQATALSFVQVPLQGDNIGSLAGLDPEIHVMYLECLLRVADLTLLEDFNRNQHSETTELLCSTLLRSLSCPEQLMASTYVMKALSHHAGQSYSQSAIIDTTDPEIRRAVQLAVLLLRDRITFLQPSWVASDGAGQYLQGSANVGSSRMPLGAPHWTNSDHERHARSRLPEEDLFEGLVNILSEARQSQHSEPDLPRPVVLNNRCYSDIGDDDPWDFVFETQLFRGLSV
jgi:hypothetical protein